MKIKDILKRGKKFRIPRIGMRITKSAVAVALCYLVFFIRGNNGILFYSQLAALWCIQTNVENSRQNGIQRFLGTVIGAVYGLLYLLLRTGVQNRWPGVVKADGIFISLMIIVILYTTVLIKKKQASYFCCTVFLSIVVNHVADVNAFVFVFNRLLDTAIGIAIGMGVNAFALPKERRKDVLYISGIDHILVDEEDTMSDYTKVELNRLLAEGINFTISTVRTPASLIKTLEDININLPVIAMDGAVLYDIKERQYLKTYIISNEKSRRILGLIREQGLHSFINVIVDDMLMIYYEDMEDDNQINLVKRMRRSPYRNYIKKELPRDQAVVYFLLVYPDDIIWDFYEFLKKRGISDELKVAVYDAVDMPGYSYLKIYNRNASKERMTGYLMEMIGIQKTVTLGTVPEKYDVCIKPGDTNKLVQLLKKMYQPVKLRF